VRCIEYTGIIGGISCGSATINGTLIFGQSATNVSASVPYTGGNGGAHNGQTVTSTGVSGLSATLLSGSFVDGSGSLVYTITGNPFRLRHSQFYTEYRWANLHTEYSGCFMSCKGKLN
jgi:hypothetical protein